MTEATKTDSVAILGVNAPTVATEAVRITDIGMVAGLALIATIAAATPCTGNIVGRAVVDKEA